MPSMSNWRAPKARCESTFRMRKRNGRSLSSELHFDGIKVNRQRIAPAARLVQTSLRGLEITAKNTALAGELGRFVPVDVIVDVRHARIETLTKSLHFGQALRDAPCFSIGQSLHDIVVLGDDRSNDRVGVCFEHH